MLKTEFLLPRNQVYLCGHSLGPISTFALNKINEVTQQWTQEAVKAWGKCSWIDLPYTVANKVAKLIGASSHEVVMSDSTSVNLFKVLVSALKINNKRHIILTTEDNFPADLYVAQGILNLNGNIKIQSVRSSDILDLLDETVSVLMLTHVNYRDSSVFDMAAITQQAHRFGILVIWDLSHSAGAIPINLGACEVDFAVGCTYKYLNGGPGAPAFIYVNERHHDQIVSPICGWMGHQRPFGFELNYQSVGIAQYIVGTPYVLGLKTLEGALDVFEKINVQDLYDRNLQYSNFLINSLEQLGLHCVTPKQGPRGGHVAFVHQHGYVLSRALIDAGVIVDYREPDLIRLCVNALYVNLEDIQVAIQRLESILKDKNYLKQDYKKNLKVT